MKIDVWKCDACSGEVRKDIHNISDLDICDDCYKANLKTKEDDFNAEVDKLRPVNIPPPTPDPIPMDESEAV